MSNATQEPITPKLCGYSMPAEWAAHRATWLAWPHNERTWPTQLEQARLAWIEMISVLSRYEHVCLLVNDEPTGLDVIERLRQAGTAASNLSLFYVPTVDVWIRDYGPSFVTRPTAERPLALVDWVFNAWGRKYEAYENDDQVAKTVASLLGLPVFETRIVLEGGSIEVNGEGTCLTTEQCLLNPNRNSDFKQSEIERRLRDSLGVTHIIWLGDGIAGDDTDGHIDDIARFVNSTTVVCAVESNPRDENYTPLQKNYERLQSATDQTGAKLAVVKLPLPAPINYEGCRLPASYANFYIANAVVLVPTFGDPNDREALGILQELFPDRRIVGIRSDVVVAGLGAIHCVTQQEPKISPLGT